MERVLVIAARKYDFKGEDGRSVVGMNVTYLNGQTRMDPDGGGMEPIKMSAPDVAVFDSLSAIPGIYDLETGTRAGKGGKAQAVLTSIRLVRAVEAGELLELGA